MRPIRIPGNAPLLSQAEALDSGRERGELRLDAARLARRRGAVLEESEDDLEAEELGEEDDSPGPSTPPPITSPNLTEPGRGKERAMD